MTKILKLQLIYSNFSFNITISIEYNNKRAD